MEDFNKQNEDKQHLLKHFNMVSKLVDQYADRAANIQIKLVELFHPLAVGDNVVIPCIPHRKQKDVEILIDEIRISFVSEDHFRWYAVGHIIKKDGIPGKHRASWCGARMDRHTGQEVD